MEDTICRIVRAESLEPLFPMFEGFGKVWIVCDRNVWGSVGEKIQDGLSGTDAHGQRRLLGASLIDATEENKTLATVESIVGEMLEKGADRNVLLLGVGGGITTDIAGFAASVYKRGVRFAFVPTTLLAQVDAAIGGKNGVNYHSYKNMIGVIRQPEFTYIYNEPLKTLSSEAFLSGVAELLKTFIIADADAYSEALCRLRKWNGSCGEGKKNQYPEIGDLAAEAAGIKAGIVQQDPDEHGLRRVLNLGHTFAHAIEKLSGGKWSHGLAVSVGMVMAASLAEKMDGKAVCSDGETFACEHGLAARLESDFRSIGLPTQCPYGAAEMAGAMSRDKKAEGGKVNFILPQRIGAVKTVKLSPYEL